MSRLSSNVTACIFGSLALVSAAACEERRESTPDTATTPAQEPTTVRPTPLAPPPSVDYPTLPSMEKTTTPGTAAQNIEKTDTVPVRGTDPDFQASGGAGGSGGHGGQGGHAGHAGKAPH